MLRTNIILVLITLLSLTAQTTVGQGQTEEPFFRTDSAFIIGQIVGMDSKAMPKQVTAVWNNALTNITRDNAADVGDDGRFVCRLQLQHPVLSRMFIPEGEQVPFYLVPGETLHIVLNKDADGHWNCDYGDGSSAKQVERLLKANPAFSDERRMMLADKSDLKRHTELCDSVLQATYMKMDAMAEARHFTPYERQLACIMATSEIDASFLARHGDLFRQDIMRSLTDSVFLAKLCAPEYYAPLKHLPLNDPALFVPYGFSLLPVVLAGTPVCASASYLVYYAEEQQKLRRALNKAMGDNDNLLTQIVRMQKLPGSLTRAKETYEHRLQALSDTTLTEEDHRAWEDSYVPLDSVYHRVVDGFTQPELRQLAERLFATTFNDTIARPIPEGEGKALLEKIIAPYRGQFVLIDFWAMWCGPCKQAIEESRELRSRLKDNPDLRLIFVAQEDAPDTNAAYRQYVQENLLGADCHPISRQELNQLMELLQFRGIPHYVTISPDGRLMRTSLNYFSNNYELFLQRLDEMKANLKE